MVILFTAAVFASAMLLFAVQPIAARIALPLFGGTPAVWTSAMLLFQILLLAGYAYAHLLTTRVPQRVQGIVHTGVMLVCALALPIALPQAIEAWLIDSGQLSAWRALVVLGATAGGPFFAVSTLGPLLQRWFASTGHRHAGDPYFLYAASNLGSLIGLLGYPLLIEPAAGLVTQGWWWTIGYALLTPLVIACAVVVTRKARAIDAQAHTHDRAHNDGHAPTTTRAVQPLTHATRLRWIGLAFIPSSLMLGVTLKLTTDVAAFPLLWVLPLSLYLMSFVLAFAQRTGDPARLPSMLWVLVAPGVALALVGFTRLPAMLSLPVHLMGLFVGAWLCHGRLAATRPDATRLTEFYLLISIGGALGGVFNALLAPVLFNDVWEYPAALALVALAAIPLSDSERAHTGVMRSWPAAIGLGCVVGLALFFGGRWFAEHVQTLPTILMLLPVILLALGLAVWQRPRACALVLAVLFLIPQRAFTSDDRVRSRSFFGVHTVSTTPDGMLRIYAHGTTRHGMQRLEPDADPRDVAYYGVSGPVGTVFAHLQPKRFAIVGLGIGTLVAYGQPGAHADLIEIDPDVVRIARDQSAFTYLSDAPCDYRVIVADGRLAMKGMPAGGHNLIVLDAFSSDSIPVHLITLEAMSTYLDALHAEGLLLMNISNRYMNLEPLVAAIADELGLAVCIKADLAIDPQTNQRPAWRFPSKWAVFARSPELLEPIASQPGWTTPVASEEVPVWTDDRANPLAIIRWR